jgi:hypothetical protein
MGPTGQMYAKSQLHGRALPGACMMQAEKDQETAIEIGELFH